jgi:two-component system chemotaxis response regulator CheY
LARKILLADDSVTAQNMGRKILADAGYDIVTVNNGSAALKKIPELKPDLVILDVYMPGYSGLEVCQRLKESQELAHIPVLLSVGKLEPFKPEEAQRVRAEGYIVKPFEASELLSALSKLEDKIVPRSEPSRPGRLARAIAAVEDNSHAKENESSKEGGWKSRLGFPAKKTVPEEKAAEEPSIYNPMNRDLRTVVETSAEKAAGEVLERQQERQQENQQEEKQSTVEENVDVAALMPMGLPKDVTPEEVASIAAASAQIQMAADFAREESGHSASSTFDAPSAPDVVNSASADFPVKLADDETRVKAVSENEDRISAGAPIAEAATAETTVPENHQKSDLKSDISQLEDHSKSEEAHDLQMTMAAAAGANSSRWMAFPVALESEEASLSLEREMQTAYATFVRDEISSTVPDESSVAATMPSSSAAVESTQPSAAEAVSEIQPEAVPALEVMQPARSEEVSHPENVSVSKIAAESINLEHAPLEVPQAEVALQAAEPSAQNFDAAQILDALAATESEIAHDSAGRCDSFSNFDTASRISPAQHVQVSPESVKTTAAAWASWRQIRDTNETTLQAAEASAEPSQQPAEAHIPQDTEAMAVAAGAEQSPQDAASENSDIASIVDSVLADLRPKLMAEITRKMAGKK